MTGSWLAIVQGFAGMRVIDDELQFAPFLPKEWTGYKFRINFRGRLLSISVSQEGTQIDLLKGDDLTIKLNGKDLKLTAK
jgi:maltose phosphorylase